MTERTRREFLGQLGGAAVGAAAALGLDGCRVSAERPNILLILADDLGYHDLGCYGQTKIRTPHVDRLAAEGVRLTAHYSGSPVCAPSRCALLTGLHTGHAYIRDNDELPERGDVWNDPALEGQRPIPSDTVTIATVLKTAGYDTAIIGKWGLGGPGSEGEPTLVGFDYAFGYLCQRQAHNYYPDHLWRNGRRVALDNPTFSAHQKFPADKDPADPASYDAYRGRQYSHDVMLEDAVDYIRTHRSKPFFLHLTPTIPHLALQVPEDSLAEYLGSFPETPYLGQKSYLPQRAPRAAYAAMVSRLDRGVGRLIDTLRETGLDRRTLVIFTSDNGATFDVGGFDPAFFQSNAPWRGAKQDLYEGGIRVPFVAWWPGQIPAGTVRDDASACWDLMPTFTQLAGARAPARLDGVSLWPALAGQGPVRRDYLYWEFQGKQALRQGNWKALRNARTGDLELYDLAADPGETRNVAVDHPDVAARLTRTLASARVESRLFPLTSRRSRG
jgi:arylsulfatase A